MENEKPDFSPGELVIDNQGHIGVVSSVFWCESRLMPSHDAKNVYFSPGWLVMVKYKVKAIPETKIGRVKTTWLHPDSKAKKIKTPLLSVLPALLKKLPT